MASFPFLKSGANTRTLSAQAAGAAALSPEARAWNSLSAPILVKEFGAIDYIDFSPVEPHYFAVTCSVRVQVYNPITRQVVKNLSRFRECAYGGSFRSDGKLLVAGGDESVVRLFDVQSKSLLRLFSGHSAPVHRTFFTLKQTNIASFSDDKTVGIWDIANEAKLSSFSEHEDYVRAGATSPVSMDILLSGGYDGKVNMYDIRTGNSVFSVDHGSPVESLLFLPTGGIFLSCGGTEIKVWDAFTGGKLLACLSQHHKTITCMHLASENKRLLSGSLDRHVKIYDLTTFKVVHTLDYPNAILSLATPQNNETLVVGMVDGLISIRRKEEQLLAEKNKQAEFKEKIPTYVDLVVPESKSESSAKYDVHLRKFRYSKALDSVMVPYVSIKTPEITVSLFQELIRRKVLHSALAGREERNLINILKFLIKNIGDARFTLTLIEVGNIFMSVYEDSITSFGSGLFRFLKILEVRLREEIELAKDMTSLEGMFSLILLGSTAGKDSRINGNLPTYHTPSVTANKNFVINV